MNADKLQSYHFKNPVAKTYPELIRYAYSELVAALRFVRNGASNGNYSPWIKVAASGFRSKLRDAWRQLQIYRRIGIVYLGKHNLSYYTEQLR